jgi:hypothetical protein
MTVKHPGHRRSIVYAPSSISQDGYIGFAGEVAFGDRVLFRSKVISHFPPEMRIRVRTIRFLLRWQASGTDCGIWQSRTSFQMMGQRLESRTRFSSFNVSKLLPSPFRQSK